VKHTFQAALAATVILGVASAAHADLTINGAVGLPLNPTAQIPQRGGARVQGNYYDMGNTGGVDFSQYGIYAAGRIASTIEINGGFSKLSSRPNSVLDQSGIAFGAKYLFSRESDPAGVRLAVGAGYDRALVRNTHAYVVATKYLGAVTGEKVPITGHLGLRYDRFRPGNLIPNSSKASIYAGLEVPITRTGDFSFVGELQSRNNEYSRGVPYSASVRYRPKGQGFSASLGLARQGLTGDNGLFAQLGYSFATSQVTGG